MASSSATSLATFASAEASAHRLIYDVFLSFRGVDTREGITSAIYDGLQNMREIKTFIDGYNVEVGDRISSTLLTAIEESRFAIIVLSQHYADSYWCLEELITIFQCMKDNKRILPVFYQVEPSDVRYQKRSFEDAFKKHESRYDRKKVMQWKDALNFVANLSGWDSNKYRSDKELVNDIVKLVWSRVLQVRIGDELTSSGFEIFEATKLAMDKVMLGLKDAEVAVIGLYGVGGVGKTSLVKHACVQARDIGLFNKVIVAVVSQSLDIKRIRDQLADMLALDIENVLLIEKNKKIEDVTEEDRANVLQETIQRGNKLLIILDDMWSRVPLSSIGIPNNKDLQRCNSKVLFTTRLKKVCQEMQSDVKINLTVLSEEDSLKLFLKKARLTFQESTEIYSAATKVARNCSGVPVALVTVAKALRDEDLDEWKTAAEQLHESQLVEPEDEKHAFNCIKLSYDYLKSSDAKLFLQLCCLFPEDYDIPIEDLFRYGIGKGLFQESDTLQEARASADLVLKSLKDADLLLDSEVKGCVKLHDVVRDAVLSISSSEDGLRMFVRCGHDVTEWPKVNADLNCSAISLMNTRIGDPPEELVWPTNLVQILSVKNSHILFIPDSFLQNQGELRVLDLRDNDIDQLPGRSLELLSNLRALFITGSAMDKKIFCFLQKLEKLEILSLKNYGYLYGEDCRQHLGNLSKLKILEIRDDEVRFPCHVISKLINLEELYMKEKIIWGRTDLCCDEFIGLPKLNVLEVLIHDTGCLPKVVDFNPHWVKFDITFNADICVGYLEYLPQYESQNALCLDTTINNLPSWFNKVVTERAEKLVYYWFRDMKNILVEYGNGRLHGVKYLAVIAGTSPAPFFSLKWRELMKAVIWDVPVFENLEELHVEEIPCVALCAGELPLGSLRNLKKLKVLNCSNMKNALLSSNLLKRLKNLEELLCGDLPRIKYVFGTKGMEREHFIIFSKLRKIHLSNLQKLKDICHGPALPHMVFQNLKSLVVGECPALKYVFPYRSIVECLVQLEELYVYKCPIMEAIIGASEEEDNVDMIEFPELTILFLYNLEKLTRFYGINESHQPIINCPKMEQITVSCCFKFGMAPSKLQRSNEVLAGDQLSAHHDDVHKTRMRLHKESRGRCSPYHYRY